MRKSFTSKIQEVIFHSPTPWCTIEVYRLSLPETFVDNEGRTVTRATTVTAPAPPGERTSQIWFLSEDLNRADTLEYLRIDRA